MLEKELVLEPGGGSRMADAGDGGPYRDALVIARLRVAELLEQERRRTDEVRAVEEIRARRLAQRAGAIAGLAGLGTGLAVALGTWGLRGTATLAVLGAGLLALLTWFAAHRLLRAGIGERLAARLRSSGDPFADLARLEAGAAARELLDETRGLEVSSVALPMVVKSLLLPLSLHFVVAAVILSGDRSTSLMEFDVWIAISGMIVGHCHLLLAGLCIRFARRLQRGEPVSRAAGWWALLWVTLASLVPGAVLYAIPPAIVAVTGMLFIPLMFLNARETVLRERDIIEALATSRTPA